MAEECDIAIVGAGIMGAMTACELARDGAKVALIDQSALPNRDAASFDHSKVFRFVYPDQLYAQLAVAALKLWRELEETSGERLLTPTGVLMIGRDESSSEREAYDALRSLDLAAELLESSEAARRFPQFNPAAFEFAVYDANGAILHAELALRAALKLARQRGVAFIEGQRVIRVAQSEGGRVVIDTESAGKYQCEQAVIASGPWTRKLLPLLDSRLTATRQETVYFEPASASALSFEPGRFPIFIELDSGFYGFPVHHRGWMKIANHHKGATADPYDFDDSVGDDFIESCRVFFRQFIPALSNARVRETRVCLYNNTPDDDFVIDWHPEIENVLIVTGFSGHGFKFGSVVGRLAAELLRSRRTSYNIERFSLRRLMVR
ncbi:MAG: N-methyl-L-tryptophan oxidase [Blastocatellia bacterium]